MAFDQNKPANNGTLASVDMRNNFTHIKNAVDKEHVWDDADPANTTHRLDQIKATVTASTVPNWQGNPSVFEGPASGSVLTQVTGIPAGTYSIQALIQALVTKSHTHGNQSMAVTNCNCTCNCDGSCFVAGSKVLMDDWTWKNIEDVQIGDKVIGIDGKSNIVTAFVQGYTTKMGKLDSIGLDDLYFTISHNFWVQYGDKLQVWGSNDKALHLTSAHDAMVYDSYDIKGMALPYATIYGWNNTRVQEVGNVKPTKVFNFKVSGSHSYIVNGYVVSGCACEYNDFDWSVIDWRGLKGVAN
ncbi:MAG: hypothetical protein K0Q75_124 [Anaerospora sp.]|nr:hypothetical protein [Anaerospora sp.]